MANFAKKPKPIVTIIGDKMYAAYSIRNLRPTWNLSQTRNLNIMGDEIPMRD